MFEKAKRIAEIAHKGQVRLGGEPFINHPMRLTAHFDSETRKTVAVLHDLVEDTNWTLEDLRNEGFSDEVVDAVDSLTRREHESYLNFILRAAKNEIGKEVKLIDVEDNLADCEKQIADPKMHSVHRQKFKYLRTRYQLARYILTHLVDKE